MSQFRRRCLDSARVSVCLDDFDNKVLHKRSGGVVAISRAAQSETDCRDLRAQPSWANAPRRSLVTWLMNALAARLTHTNLASSQAAGVYSTAQNVPHATNAFPGGTCR